MGECFDIFVCEQNKLYHDHICKKLTPECQTKAAVFFLFFFVLFVHRKSCLFAIPQLGGSIEVTTWLSSIEK